MIRFHCLGCRVNQAEIEKYKGSMSSSDTGGIIVDVINSCAVTQSAESKSKKLYKKIIQKNKNGKIILTGCWLQKNKNFLQKNKPKNVFLVTNSKKDEILKLIKTFSKKTNVKNFTIPKRTRAYIKIQDGYKNICTYCIVKELRPQKSQRPDLIIKYIKQKIRENYKEIVLCGINIGQYKYGIKNLINKILKVPEITRIRISSINIIDIDKHFIDLLKNQRICPYLHIPLQSGSNKILKLMKRPYTLSLFLKKINLIKKEIPGIALATDIIVGFPQEQELDFKQTCDIIKNVGFSKIHIFPYSERSGTEAEKLPNKHDPKIISQRIKKLAILAANLRKDYITRFIGKQVKVLFESSKNGFWHGWSGNYIRVRLKSVKNLKNKIMKVKLTKSNVAFK